MVENGLQVHNYYDRYDGIDLNEMNRCVREMTLPLELIEKIRQKPSANLLVLGSATSSNLFWVSRIDQYLRPSKVEQDVATIVDINKHPLTEHQPHILIIEGKDGWLNEPQSTPEYPYPRFRLAQADMRELPLVSDSVDVVVSDFTLNFLPDLSDIAQTFQEVSRVMSQDSLALISVRVDDEEIDQELAGKIKIFKYPFATYIRLAEEYGLELLDTQAVAKDTYMAFRKQS